MTTYRPHPRARQAVREALGHYPLGLTSTELRRRCGRLVHAIDEDGRNVTEDLAAVLEYLLDAGLVEQRLVGRSVRFVDPIRYPAITSTEESETPA
jgi:DNA-binding transcriptional ArsR family regulator